ncbi:MAG: hypothetical protein DMENIID0003_06790 [Wolbachia endosymbiont of Sergentomyia squamirostris]|uniref:Uncharacterized protein n=1 Tax=Wolbachia endosymbiont of Sergentomyia squamirostris TaxID=3113640 RepID=A0AAT9GCR0_9RICK
MGRQLFKQSVVNGCYTMIFSTGIAISLFIAGMIEVNLTSIIVSVAIASLVSLAIGCITYDILRSSTQVDKVEKMRNTSETDKGI